MNEMSFTPDRTRLPANADARIAPANGGAVMHSLTLRDSNIRIDVQSGNSAV